MTESESRAPQSEVVPTDDSVLDHERTGSAQKTPMQRIRTHVRWLVFGALLPLSALLVLAFWLPGYVEQNPQWVASRVSQSFGQPVSIKAISGRWEGGALVFDLDKVSLLDSKDKTAELSFSSIALRLSAWQSLLSGEPVIDTLTIRGTSLSIVRTRDRSLRIAGARLGSRSGKGSGFPSWLFSAPSIELRDTRLLYTDERHLEDFDAVRFHNGQLNIRNTPGQHHEIRGRLSLPDLLGRELHISASLQGDMATREWSGEFRVKGEGLRVAQWLKHLNLAGARFHSGQLSLSLVSNWQHSLFTDGTLQLAVTGLALKDPQAPTRVGSALSAEGKLAVSREAGLWRVRSDDLQFQGATGVWPGKGLSLDIRVPDKGGKLQLFKASLPVVQIADIWPWALASPRLSATPRSALLGTQPRVELHHVAIDWQAQRPADRRWQVSSEFSDLALEAWRQLPALQGIAGKVQWRDARLHIALDTNKALVFLPTLFDDAFPLDGLRGDLQLVKQDARWQVKGEDLRLYNEHLKLHGGFVYTSAETGPETVEADGSSPGRANPDERETYSGDTGELALRFDFEDGHASNVSLYLPSKLFSKSTSALLDPLVVNGRVPSGFVSFQGRLDDFPFTPPPGSGTRVASGEFRVEFDAEDVELDYAPGWPHITEASGHVTFLNQGMQVRAKSGRIWNTQLKRVEASIANLDQAELKLKGQAIGPAGDMLKLIRETGMKEAMGKSFEELDLRGDVDLKLALDFPVDTDAPVFSGNVEFLSNDLTLAKRGIALQRLSGNMRLDNHGIYAERLNARFFKRPVDLTINTRPKTGSTLINLQGRFGLQDFIKDRHSPLRKLAQGRSAWSLDLTLPAPDQRKAAPGIRLRSALEATALNLPRPLNLLRKERLNLQLDTRLVDSSDTVLHLSLGKSGHARLLRGRIVLGNADGKKVVLKGLRLGVNSPLPAQSGDNEIGIRVRGKFVDADAWLEVAQSMGPEVSQGDVLRKSIDVGLERIRVFGRDVSQANMQIKQDRYGDWTLLVDSKEIKGTIRIPRFARGARPDQAATPVIAFLDYLHLAESAPDQGPATPERSDPSKAPPLRVVVEDFRYGSLDLGRLELESTPLDNGMKLRQLDISNPAFTVKGWGEWLNTPQDGVPKASLAGKKGDRTAVAPQTSRFDLTLSTDKLAATLEKLELAKALESKHLQAHLRASWQGAPATVSLARLEGDLSLQLGEGRILEVSPGAGRVLGILSLTALPRRLRGDFADVFDKGFVFSEIKGDFALADGVATTHDLVMQGPAADIGVTGTVGLLDRSYDQQVTVTPKISSTLPLAGVLAGGVGAGVVMLLAEQVLKKPINRIAQYQYSIKGSWDKPEIKALGKKEALQK